MNLPTQVFNHFFVYDPLDRMASINAMLLFYNQTRLATEIEGERINRLFECDSRPLALQQDGATCTLLTTDMQTSVRHSISTDGTQQAHAYTPFGHQRDATVLHSVCGFNGERPDPVTGHYLLGQGYRAFNPVLMRFNSPDNLSPFGKGGTHAYAYCGNDPINRSDPTGHFWKLLKRAWKIIKPRTPPRSPTLSRRSSASATSLSGNWTFHARPSEPLSHLSTSSIIPPPPSRVSALETTSVRAPLQPATSRRRVGINLAEGDPALLEIRNRFGTPAHANAEPPTMESDLPSYQKATRPQAPSELPSYTDAYRLANSSHERHTFLTTPKAHHIRTQS